MFAEIAPHYDRLNGVMSLSMHGRWRARAVRMLGLRPGDHVLDLCCGTGDFIAPLRRAVGSTGQVFGIDFCLPMLDLAQKKADRADVLALGDATMIPCASDAFHAVTVGWGIRNVPDIDAAHREIFRVLRPGGSFVSLDMAMPRSAIIRATSRWMLGTMLPILGRLFGSSTAYQYLPKSTERFLSREGLLESMQQAGFIETNTVDLMLGNICIHYGRKP